MTTAALPHPKLSTSRVTSRRYVLLLMLLLLINASLKMVLALDPHLHPADERYHALVAKNLLASPFTPMLYADPAYDHGYADWSQSHYWLHKPPLTTYMIALSMKIFGVTTFAVRVPSIVLSTAAIALTYLLGRRLGFPGVDARLVALLSAYFHAVCGILITLAAGYPATDHVDAQFLFWVELAIYLAVLHTGTGQSKYLVLLGLAFGAALLTKWLNAAFIPLVYMALAFSARLHWKAAIKQNVIFCLVAFAVAFPWWLYTHLRFPAESAFEQRYNFRHLLETLEYQNRPWYQYFRDLLTQYSYLVPLPIAAFLAVTVQRVRHWSSDPVAAGRFLAVSLWFLVPYGVFSCVATRMPGYVWVAAPAIFLMCGWFVAKLLNHFSLSVSKRRVQCFYGVGAPEKHGRGGQCATNSVMLPKMQIYKKITIPALIILLPLLTLAQSAILAVPGLRTPRWYWLDGQHEARTSFVETLRARTAGIAEHSPRTVIFNVPEPIDAMFFTPFTAYSQSPTPELLERLRAEGRRVYLWEELKTQNAER